MSEDRAKNMQNKQNILRKVKELMKSWEADQIPRLAQHEVHPDLHKSSRENYLYFTLPPCLNFQRNSPAMWAAALKTYEDPHTQWVFFPEKVATKSREDVQKALLKHKLALQLNKHTDIWIAISSALNTLFENDPRKLLEAGEFDVAKIHDIIQIHHKARFPYLRGPKLSHYWLFILMHYTDVKLRNVEAISIIPDTHVLQSTVQLGLTDKIETPEKVVALWKELLMGSGIAPFQMHSILWNWSRNSFKPEV